jgi:hypothetical protein
MGVALGAMVVILVVVLAAITERSAARLSWPTKASERVEASLKQAELVAFWVGEDVP